MYIYIRVYIYIYVNICTCMYVYIWCHAMMSLRWPAQCDVSCSRLDQMLHRKGSRMTPPCSEADSLKKDGSHYTPGKFLKILLVVIVLASLVFGSCLREPSLWSRRSKHGATLPILQYERRWRTGTVATVLGCGRAPMTHALLGDSGLRMRSWGSRT